jgi:type I restriction enzyme M protein
LDLIPPALMVVRYLADQRAKVDELAAAADEATRAVEEYVEEHAVEEGLLSEAMDDGKITKVLAAARLREAKRERAERAEIKALEHLISRYDAESKARKAAKDVQAALDLATLQRYGDLTEPDIKQDVLDDKWHATIADRVAGEVESLTLDLVARIQQLGERYARTVADLDAELAELERRVAGHLAAMGVES